MSVQTCCRDQRKMGQVIDQMKILANNLDELRSEIDALKGNFLKKDSGFFQQTGDIKNNIVRKLKRYMRKVTSISERKSDNQEVYYPCTNSDAPMPSFLNYIFRIGKREDVWQIPTRVKYLNNEGNQTDEKLEELEETAENKIYSHEYVTMTPRCSDISCELDSRVETPFSSATNLPSNLSTTQIDPKNSSQNTKVSLPNGVGKRLTAATTQTTAPRLRRNRKVMKSQSKNKNIYFSKFKNGVITKKTIRNSNESTLRVCRNDYSYLKKKFDGQYPWDKKKGSNIETVNNGKMNKEFSLDKIIQRLKDISSTNDETLQEDSWSSSSVSVDLEVNISNSSSKIDEFTERRKPRTYVVRKSSQKRDQDNWSNHFEKSIIYVGSTSDLTLFSHSFLN
ncbi:uncharacterized protein LOC117608013 isoform X1 [Osmia lignaria lignaria]|uniref:uncharacterized protein LOC117608013 isoform X1 n=2 Tax=Osmia lignaria lignaria TaxID=1437193 RepID=UPI0014794375|nr:uncharacterized protein LOC117608013 isoform X1 [Osmia lignaria]